MKKLVFSAVALVAFSFAGMANNSVEKEVNEKIETTVEVSVENLGDGGCGDQYAETLNTFVSLEMDFMEAHSIASSIFRACMAATYPDSDWN